MLKRGSPLSSAWFWLGGLLSSTGGIPLLSGAAAGSARTKAVAMLLVGLSVLAIAFFLRRRERRAIARGTMPPNEEL
jgi:MYXO-CTERM domain-containing protein